MGKKHTTFFAMEEIRLPANSTDTTVVAMILPFLGVIVEEFADIAKVLPHFHSTIGTYLCNLKPLQNFKKSQIFYLLKINNFCKKTKKFKNITACSVSHTKQIT